MRTADGLPVVFEEGSEGPLPLTRISPLDPSVAEHQIQQLVFDHPDVLPIQEFGRVVLPGCPGRTGCGD